MFTVIKNSLVLVVFFTGWVHVLAAGANEVAIRFTKSDFPEVLDTRSLADADKPTGAAALDINGDDLVDIFIGQGEGKSDLLMIQNRNGGWAQQVLDDQNTRATYSALAVDLNRDFRPDLIVARAGSTMVYLNTPEDGLVRMGPLDHLDHHHGDGTTTTLVAADFNADGWIDVHETRRDGSGGDSDRLWINQGRINNGIPVFRDEAAARGIDSCCASAATAVMDIDADNDMDLLVVGLGGGFDVYVNDGEGRFSAKPIPVAKGEWHGIATGDIDADGTIDVLIGGRTIDGAGSAVRVFLNEGNGKLIDNTDAYALNISGHVRSLNLTDFDNDGFLDITLAGAGVSAVLLRQRQSRRGFKSEARGVPGHRDALLASLNVDVNRDGRVDQLHLTEGGSVRLLKNEGRRVNWVGVRLRGRELAAIAGARVGLTLRDGSRQTAILKRGEGSAVTTNDEIMFGLGARNVVSELTVSWPSGRFTRIENPMINRHIGIVEPKADAEPVERTYNEALRNRIGKLAALAQGGGAGTRSVRQCR